jgi:hypothetical protein
MRGFLAGSGPSIALLAMLALAGLVRFPNP